MSPDERRIFPRLTLTIEDGYFGNFKLPNEETLAAPILNLSAGGLNMAVPRNSVEKIKEGDALLLKNIAGGMQLAFLSNIKAVIRWMKALDQTNYMHVGCEFKAVSEEVLLQLIQFVSSERKTRGQYD